MTSAAFIESRQRTNDPDGILELLTINHATFSGPANLVNDTRNWVSNGTTYFAYPFRFTFPQDVSGEAPRSTLEIDNVGRDLTSELERLPANAIVLATMRHVTRSDPDTVEWSWTVPLVNVSVDATVVSAVMGVDYLMRQQAVRIRHDPRTSPGIFQD